MRLSGGHLVGGVPLKDVDEALVKLAFQYQWRIALLARRTRVSLRELMKAPLRMLREALRHPAVVSLQRRRLSIWG